MFKRFWSLTEKTIHPTVPDQQYQGGWNAN